MHAAMSQPASPVLDLRRPIRYKAGEVPGSGWLTVNGMMRFVRPVGDAARIGVPNVTRRDRDGPRVGESRGAQDVDTGVVLGSGY